MLHMEPGNADNLIELLGEMFINDDLELVALKVMQTAKNAPISADDIVSVIAWYITNMSNTQPNYNQFFYEVERLSCAGLNPENIARRLVDKMRETFNDHDFFESEIKPIIEHVRTLCEEKGFHWVFACCTEADKDGDNYIIHHGLYKNRCQKIKDVMDVLHNRAQAAKIPSPEQLQNIMQSSPFGFLTNMFNQASKAGEALSDIKKRYAKYSAILVAAFNKVSSVKYLHELAVDVTQKEEEQNIKLVEWSIADICVHFPGKESMITELQNRLKKDAK